MSFGKATRIDFPVPAPLRKLTPAEGLTLYVPASDLEKLFAGSVAVFSVTAEVVVSELDVVSDASVALVSEPVLVPSELSAYLS